MQSFRTKPKDPQVDGSGNVSDVRPDVEESFVVAEPPPLPPLPPRNQQFSNMTSSQHQPLHEDIDTVKPIPENEREGSAYVQPLHTEDSPWPAADSPPDTPIYGSAYVRALDKEDDNRIAADSPPSPPTMDGAGYVGSLDDEVNDRVVADGPPVFTYTTSANVMLMDIKDEDRVVGESPPVHGRRSGHVRRVKRYSGKIDADPYAPSAGIASANVREMNIGDWVQADPPPGSRMPAARSYEDPLAYGDLPPPRPDRGSKNERQRDGKKRRSLMSHLKFWD